MLVNMNDVLYPAKKGKYAVGLFNAVNLELARGIIAAAVTGHHRNCGSSFSIRSAGRSFLLSDSNGKEGKCSGRNPSGSRP